MGGSVFKGFGHAGNADGEDGAAGDFDLPQLRVIVAAGCVEGVPAGKQTKAAAVHADKVLGAEAAMRRDDC